MKFILIFLSLFWVSSFSINAPEALRTKLGLERSGKINTPGDPRNSIRHCFFENTVFIHSDFYRVILAIDLTSKVTLFNIKLADSTLLDCFVYDRCLVLHYRGARTFDFYDAKTGKLLCNTRFPFDIQQGGIILFYSNLCLIQDPSDSTIKRIFTIFEKGAAFYFKESAWYEYDCMDIPFIDLKTAKQFPPISFRYYLGQNDDYILLKETTGDPSLRDFPSFYLYAKNLSYFKKIELPSETRRDYHFATLHRGVVYMQEYDFKTNEFVLYQYTPEKISASADFDPAKYASVAVDSVFREKGNCDR